MDKIDKKNRILKVHECYVFSKLNSNKAKIRPEIRLLGKWLQDAGFNPKDTIIVSVKKGKLIIKVADETIKLKTALYLEKIQI